jgi:hypothetical protein
MTCDIFVHRVGWQFFFAENKLNRFFGTQEFILHAKLMLNSRKEGLRKEVATSPHCKNHATFLAMFRRRRNNNLPLWAGADLIVKTERIVTEN